MRNRLRTCWNTITSWTWAVKRCAEVDVVERMHSLWRLAPYVSIFRIGFERRVGLAAEYRKLSDEQEKKWLRLTV